MTVTKTISVGFDASGLEILGPDEECEYDTVLIGPQNYTEYQWFLPNGGGEINNQGLQSVNITWNSLGQKEVQLVVTDKEAEVLKNWGTPSQSVYFPTADKIEINGKKYPVNKSYNSSKEYDEL